MTSDPQYEYSPITEVDGIRLIELQPAQNASAPLRCSLIHKKLSLCGDSDIFGHYIALSYVWGNPEKSKTILVDGRHLRITSNLHSALADLRDENRTLMIWADGVCINQGDDAEKAMQIGLMGRIYARAPHTVIYLDPAESTGPESMCLATIREGTYVNTDERLSSVLMREWFTRVWVFQEFIFSRNPWLQCGKTRIQWDLLLDILGVKDGSPEIAPAWLNKERYHIIGAMQRARKLHVSSGDTDKPNTDSSANYMVDILRARRGFGVTDPRDMIFAHVGFASDGQHEDLAVDYSKSTVQVYESSALYIAKIFGLLALLECVGITGSPERIRMLPSWVLDWSCRIPPKLYPTQYTSYGAWPLLPKIIPILLFDTVRCTSRTLSVQRIPQQSRQKISSRLSDVDFTPDGASLFLKWNNARDWDLLISAYQVWRDLLNDENILPPDMDKNFSDLGRHHESLYQSIRFYLLSILREDCDIKSVAGTRLARMASGRLALVPESAQEGDIIAVIHGLHSHVNHYLFHPIQPEGNYSSINDKIYWSAKQITRDSEEETERLKAIIEEFEALESPVLHCRFIGECFITEEMFLVEPQRYNPSKSTGIIVAIH